MANPTNRPPKRTSASTKVRHSSEVTESVYLFLRDNIASGTYPAGYALVESPLARELNVSRTPVHEALQRLQNEGLVNQGFRGLVVAQRNPEEILEMYELRSILEDAAARLAATRRTDLDLTKLQILHDVMKQIDPSKSSERLKTNLDFHIQFWRASHNEQLVDALEHLYVQLHRLPGRPILGSINEQPRSWGDILAEHEEIIAAIQSGNSDRAAQAAHHHNEKSRTIQLKIFASIEQPADQLFQDSHQTN